MPKNHYTRFPVTSPYDGEVANLLRTCYGEAGVMDFGLIPVDLLTWAARGICRGGGEGVLRTSFPPLREMDNP